MTVSIGRMNINYYLSTTAKQDGKIAPRQRPHLLLPANRGARRTLVRCRAQRTEPDRRRHRAAQPRKSLVRQTGRPLTCSRFP